MTPPFLIFYQATRVKSTCLGRRKFTEVIRDRSELVQTGKHQCLNMLSSGKFL